MHVICTQRQTEIHQLMANNFSTKQAYKQRASMHLDEWNPLNNPWHTCFPYKFMLHKHITQIPFHATMFYHGDITFRYTIAVF